MFVTNTAAAATPTDPTTKSGVAKEKLNKDLNRFLNLLTTQLKNQDPLSPMSANDFTTQLVQFASVEQQIYQNANLEKLVAIQNTNQVSTMVSYIGHTIEANSNEVPLENKHAKSTYILDPTATQAPVANQIDITVQDSAGATVYNTTGDLTAGKKNFIWDGTNNSGTAQPPGLYTVLVTAQDRAGDPINVKQTAFGRVTGAGAKDGVVQLYMGDVVTTLDKVLTVSETKKATVP